MKRHDVSNPGPDTRHPLHEEPCLLWLAPIMGWRDEESGQWCDAGGFPLESFDVIAWSDPTETESAEPLAWAVTNTRFSRKPRALTAYSTRQLAEDVAAALDPSLQVVPLYATPPDTAAVMRQAAEALEAFVPMLQSHNDRGDGSTPIFGINDAKITVGDLRRARAALAALRGAIGGV